MRVFPLPARNNRKNIGRDRGTELTALDPGCKCLVSRSDEATSTLIVSHPLGIWNRCSRSKFTARIIVQPLFHGEKIERNEEKKQKEESSVDRDGWRVRGWNKEGHIGHWEYL